MQYWINHNGVQSGPVDLDGLKQMGLTSSAYVWHEGLADWVKITQLPELQGYYDLSVHQPEPQPIRQSESPQAPVAMGEPLATEPQQPQFVEQPTTPIEPCPPTNLVWAILATVLCCLPAGIVAIVYATKVTNKYRAGDIEGAKRASETGAWWCIITIILGLLYVPFAMLFQASMN